MAHQRFLRTAVLFTLFIIPGVLFSQPDESMPERIPDEILSDWNQQGGTAEEICAALPEEYQAKCDGTFENACHWRRVWKMKPYMGAMKKILYAKHFDFDGMMVGSLEGTRSSRGTNWKVGSALYTLTMDNYYPKPEILLEDPTGVLKDPCISPDGSYAVFCWWKEEDGGGFHIYEIDMKTKKTRQITSNPVGLEVGDYEPCILPNGDIVFNSSRVFSMINNAYSLVSNLYLCNRNGDWLRRIGYDQHHTFQPVMMSDGKVLYTRWEFNDRTRISAGGYFTMNPDGSRQNEYWGNQSDFPIMKYQAREIPNSGGKLMGIAGGHIAPYQGELIIIDPAIARNRWPGNDNESIKLIAPVRKAPIDPSDGFSGHDGDVRHIFQNPWPFDDKNFLVSYIKKERYFKIYFMNVDSSRELIAWNPTMSVSQPIVIDPPCPFSKKPPLLPPVADYTKKTAIFGVKNVYKGSGSKGIAEGTINKLRVISLGPYRTNYSSSTGILGHSVVPLGAAFTSWEIKTLLGEVHVEDDGSACFEVPANTPIFFQTIDKDGRMLNTMRSWSTLMPGERFDCIGCHDDDTESAAISIPVASTPKPLEKPLGFEDQPMSFPKIIQPILDRHCISCHDATHDSGLDLRANPTYNNSGKRTLNESYMNLAEDKGKYVDYLDHYEKAAPRTFFPVPGSGTSMLAEKLLNGHKPDDLTPAELEAIFVWIDMMCPHAGSFSEGMLTEDSAKYDQYLADNRLKHAAWEKENIAAFIDAGQWNAQIYHEVGVSDPDYRGTHTMRKEIRSGLQVTLFKEKLVVRCPGSGVLSLFDIKGRLLKNVTVTDDTRYGKMQISLSRIQSSGIYVVKFKSKDTVLQQIVSSLN